MDTTWTNEIFNDVLATLARLAGSGRYPEVVKRQSVEVIHFDRRPQPTPPKSPAPIWRAA